MVRMLQSLLVAGDMCVNDSKSDLVGETTFY